MATLAYKVAPRPRRYIQLVDYCRAFAQENGAPPSYSQIRDALRISDAGTVRRYVKEAEAAGLIHLADYRGGRGPRAGQRIRLGLPEEADTKHIRMGRDL